MEAKATIENLEARWAQVEPSPLDNGSVALISRRPAPDQREALERATFTAEAGLLGDDWLRRHGDDIEAQITLMNSRVIQLLAGDKSRWAEAGDQLFVDLDISQDNLPPGARIQIGGVIMEISKRPHTGCTKFARRFGGHARKWTATETGERQRRRGVYAFVVQDGEVNVGDRIRKVR